MEHSSDAFFWEGGVLTRHVEDRIAVFGVLLQRFDSFARRENQLLDLVAFHHRQSPVCAGTDEESEASRAGLAG